MYMWKCLHRFCVDPVGQQWSTSVPCLYLHPVKDILSQADDQNRDTFFHSNSVYIEQDKLGYAQGDEAKNIKSI